MAFNNSAPLSYASGEVVKYIDAKRGLEEAAGGPKVQVNGLYSPITNDIVDPAGVVNVNAISTRLGITTTSQQILAANTDRKNVYLVNELAGNNTILIRFGGSANSTAYTFPLYAGYTYEFGSTKWAGNVHAVVLSGTANLAITDIR